MAKEIERQFLVANEEWRSSAGKSSSIRQFYVATGPNRSVRVRVRDGKALLTLKFGTAARTRDEFEYPIPVSEAEEMQAYVLGQVIEKTRHHVRHGGYLYEIDVFEGALQGLVLAELETAEEVPDAALPQWLGREVTGRSAYYNVSLATSGRPVEQP
ncbi:adenylate cyclase [Mesorhizobium soli]|uniref:CYTH domain-containing protein n=1 Tax=Pseudaminobacter soli (ex Li et al. 2025) TaxID=1295366 RepID=UPI002474CD5E|nr:CYTH domain-containing protein [Mesorhizobium soli]MDH6231953.1 adenylate cyclase [Mesorhizobium soli]